MTVNYIERAEEFERLFKTPDKLLVVQFSTAWCGPCKKIKPKIEELASKNPSVIFVYIDLEELDHLVQAVGVDSVPTFKFYRNQKILTQFTGSNLSKVIENLEKYT